MKKGFTLIELLVVISIISILVAVGTASYQKAVKLSRDSKRKADIEQLRQALETFRSENGRYPATTAPDNGLSALVSGGFIQSIPPDPKGYTYGYTRPSTTTYQLCSYLEIAPTSPAACTASCGSGVASTCNYATTQP